MEDWTHLETFSTVSIVPRYIPAVLKPMQVAQRTPFILGYWCRFRLELEATLVRS